jgi:hypothetical protein
VKNLTLLVVMIQHNILCLRDIRDIFLSAAEIKCFHAFPTCSVHVACNFSAVLRIRVSAYDTSVSNLPTTFVNIC